MRHRVHHAPRPRRRGGVARAGRRDDSSRDGVARRADRGGASRRPLWIWTVARRPDPRRAPGVVASAGASRCRQSQGGGVTTDAAALVGLLAEDGRLRVVAAVVLGAGTVEEVVAAT